MRIFAALLIWGLLQAACYEEPSTKATVVFVNDGDTITIKAPDSSRKKIRLATIDAPEMDQEFGRESRKALSEMLLKKEVDIRVIDIDKYGRAVAIVYLEDKNINEEQIRKGMAWFYRRHSDDLTLRESISYSNAEDHAKKEKLGLWSREDQTPPWEFRRNKHSPDNF